MFFAGFDGASTVVASTVVGHTFGAVPVGFGQLEAARRKVTLYRLGVIVAEVASTARADLQRRFAASDLGASMDDRASRDRDEFAQDVPRFLRGPWRRLVYARIWALF
jgi:hypothetical protein